MGTDTIFPLEVPRYRNSASAAMVLMFTGEERLGGLALPVNEDSPEGISGHTKHTHIILFP